MEVWLPKSPDWNSGVVSWTESEGTSSSELREHNIESLALRVIGLGKTGQAKRSLSLFLEDGDLARVALSCHIATVHGSLSYLRRTVTVMRGVW